MRTAAAIAALLLVATVLLGCSPAAENEPAPAGDGMGMGGGGEGGGMVIGAIAAKDAAGLEPGGLEVTSDGGVTVARVKAPVDGWVVARSSGATGTVLGYASVDRGTTSSVVLPVAAGSSSELRVALHADRGDRGVFEFDPERPERSLDKPIVVERQPLEADVELDGYGIETEPHLLSLWVKDQAPKNGVIVISQVQAPPGSWLAIHLLRDGVPGPRVGLVGVTTEAVEVAVPLSDPKATGEALVTLHADRGRQGAFEFEPAAPLAYPDQPYRIGDDVFSGRFVIR